MIANKTSDAQMHPFVRALLKVCSLRPDKQAAQLEKIWAAKWAQLAKADNLSAMHFHRNVLMAALAGASPFGTPRPPVRQRLTQYIDTLNARLAVRLSQLRLSGLSKLHASARPERILILLAMLPSDRLRNAHLRQTASYASAIALQPGVQSVHIVVSQEFHLMGEDFSFQGFGDVIGTVVDTKPCPESWVQAVKDVLLDSEADALGKITFHAPTPDATLYPYRSSLQEIRRFQPDVVLSFLGFMGSEVIPAVIHRHVPILGVQFNGLNPEPENCDLVLAQGHVDLARKRSPERWRNQQIPIRPFPKRETLGREAVTSRAIETVIVTALSVGRLENLLLRFEQKLLREICEFLSSQSDQVGWLFVGIHEPKRIEALPGPWQKLMASGRLRLEGYVPDLRAVYEHCDIYAHVPESPGGGMGIAMAIAEGLPTLVPRFADAANFMPREYCVDNNQELFTQLDALLKSERHRRDMAKAQLDAMSRQFDLRKVGIELLNHLELARRNGLERLRPPGPAAGGINSPELARRPCSFGYLSEVQLAQMGFRSLGKNVMIHELANIVNPECIDIGSHARIDGFVNLIARHPISIGRYAHIGSFSQISAADGEIVLGDYSTLSQASLVYTSSDDFSGESYIGATVPVEYRNPARGAVRIGRHCAVGARCVILPGVELADGACMGAMSLAKTSLDGWTLYAGIPVRRIRPRSQPDRLDLPD